MLGIKRGAGVVVAGSLMLILAVLGGCTSTPRGVSWYADQSCQAGTVDVDTYGVTIRNMPGFIEPVFSYTAHQAMQRLGLVPAEQPDLYVDLRFELVQLDRSTRARDDFDESIIPGPIVRFDAIVHVTVETKSDTVVWSGTLNRRHAILGDEIFHDDRAAVVLQQAFDGLLENIFTPCE
jgi:hypothetical protein